MEKFTPYYRGKNPLNLSNENTQAATVAFVNYEEPKWFGKLETSNWCLVFQPRKKLESRLNSIQECIIVQFQHFGRLRREDDLRSIVQNQPEQHGEILSLFKYIYF